MNSMMKKKVRTAKSSKIGKFWSDHHDRIIFSLILFIVVVFLINFCIVVTKISEETTAQRLEFCHRRNYESLEMEHLTSYNNEVYLLLDCCNFLE